MNKQVTIDIDVLDTLAARILIEILENDSSCLNDETNQNSANEIKKYFNL